VTSRDAPWSVQLSPTAVRALDRLPHKIAAAIAEFINATCEVSRCHQARARRPRPQGRYPFVTAREDAVRAETLRRGDCPKAVANVLELALSHSPFGKPT